MEAPKSNKLYQLEKVLSKMPLQYCMDILPEFSVRWRDVSQAVRNTRLPMTPHSVARILTRHAAKHLPIDELQDILARLMLKLVTIQSRTWHVFRLLERTSDEPPGTLIHTLAHHVRHALRQVKHGQMRPEVESIMMCDLMYLSVRFVSASKESSVVYICTPPGEPLALFSTVMSQALLKACVEGMGYKRYENLQLHGRHIPSLLRIADPASGPADQLSHPPVYRPMPVATHSGIDYTNRMYDDNYIDTILGPDPPLLTELKIKSTRPFFDKERLDKTINLSISLKSDNISKTLKSWVSRGALAPTSDLFQFYTKVRSNKIQYNREDSD